MLEKQGEEEVGNKLQTRIIMITEFYCSLLQDIIIIDHCDFCVETQLLCPQL